MYILLYLVFFTTAASFSETFYDLKRVSVHKSKLQEKLSHKQQVLSLIIIVAFPYLKTKLEQLSSKYILDETDNQGILREAGLMNIFFKVYNMKYNFPIIDTEKTEVTP